MRSVKVWGVKCGDVWSVKSGAWSVKCGVWSVEPGGWSVECQVRTVKYQKCSVLKCKV